MIPVNQSGEAMILANELCLELDLPWGWGNKDIIARCIEIEAHRNNWDLNEARLNLQTLAISARNKGTKLTRFWFENQEYLGDPVMDMKARQGMWDGKPSTNTHALRESVSDAHYEKAVRQYRAGAVLDPYDEQMLKDEGVIKP